MAHEGTQETIRIQFFGKSDCCLCDQALNVLESLRREFPLLIEKIDVSSSPGLLARYGNDIPVATLEGRELFRHRAEKGSLRSALRLVQTGTSDEARGQK